MGAPLGKKHEGEMPPNEFQKYLERKRGASFEGKTSLLVDLSQKGDVLGG